MSSTAAEDVVVALMGPTASGKSAVAMALAARWPVEIVSVDSAQVYRGMDVGTAKPGPHDRAAVPHHLVDILEPSDPYSAARFREDALRAVAAIRRAGRIPLLVGGTMLYYKALRDGLAPLPQADPAIRESIEATARLRGWPAMHEELARVDPATAQRLAPNDSQRIQRALEVFRASGTPLSRWLANAPATPLPFRLAQIALVPADRAQLHTRIAARFDDMLASGLVEELESLRARHTLSKEMPSMRAVGYRQAWDYLEGTCGRAELRERGIHATRQLAKRQITWLRSWPDLTSIECGRSDTAPLVDVALAQALDSQTRLART